MKKRIRSNADVLLFTVVYAVVAACGASNAFSQGVCVRERLTLNGIRGSVLNKSDVGDVALSNAIISVTTDSSSHKQVAMVTSGDGGRFRVVGNLVGSYILKVAYPNLKPLETRVHLIRRMSRNDEVLIVSLGGDFTKPCGGTSVIVQRE